MDKRTLWDRLALVSIADLRARQLDLGKEYKRHLILLDALEMRKTELDDKGSAERSLRSQQNLARQVADLDHQAALQEQLLSLIGKQQKLLDRLIWARESAERWENLRRSAPAAAELGWDDLASAAADLTVAEDQLDGLLRILGVPEVEWPQSAPHPVEPGMETASWRKPHEPVLIADVLDGRTIHLATGEMVRYIGVDAPLLRSSLGQPVPGAREAWQANRELVEGKSVHLEADAKDRDTNGALWRFVWVDQTCVNAELIRGGFVYHQPRSPNYRHTEWFSRLERQARRKKRGIWG